MNTNKLFDITLNDIRDVKTFFRVRCTTCRVSELMDENGKPVDKNAKTDGGILRDLNTDNGKYNCKKCMKKLLEDPDYTLIDNSGKKLGAYI